MKMNAARNMRVLVWASAGVLMARSMPAAEALLKAAEKKAVTVPERAIPEPEARGKPYKVPATNWKQDPVLWGWTCEWPDGSGLAFGGVHQTAGDGLAHTQFKEGSAWKPILEELRNANPLQKRFDQVRALRSACKDTLAKARHIYFNVWTAGGHQEKSFPADTRSARYWPPAAPEQFMAGARPDAAAHEAQLKALPVNAWVRLKTPVPLGGRDWGTWVFDPDRDMFYVWSGGHCSYAGNDVARYHSTPRPRSGRSWPSRARCPAAAWTAPGWSTIPSATACSWRP